MRRDIAGRTLRFGRMLRNVQRLAADELKSPMRVPLGRKVWAWRRGFLSRSAVRFGLTDGNRHLYVSDWARYVKTPTINGRFGVALDNKIIFSRILASYGCAVPEYYCLIREGRMLQVGSRYRMRRPSDVVNACLSGGDFVLKPYTGGGGLSVAALSSRDGKLLVNWEERSRDEVTALISGITDGVVSQFVHQHDIQFNIIDI